MTTIEVRRGTAAEWTTANPVLAAGEPGLEVDTGSFKFGDGLSTWDMLPYFLNRGSLDVLYADRGLGQDAMRPISHPYGPPPKMVAQANSPGHGWAWGSGNTATLNLNDTGFGPTGTQSVRLLTNGVGGPARIDNSSLSFDWTEHSPVLWMMVEDVSMLGGLSLFLGDHDLTNYFLWNFAPRVNDKTEFLSGQFVKIVLNWSDAISFGNPNRGTISRARLYAQDRSSGPVAVHFSGLAAQAQETGRYPNGVVVFTFDDGRISQYNGARPALDKYGFPGTAYVIAERIDSTSDWMSTTQLQALQNQSGWEIGAHSYSRAIHDQAGGLTASAPEDIAEDFAKMKRWLSERGLRGCDHLAYPQGLINAQVLEVARRYFASGRTTWGKTGASEVWPPADSYRIKSRMLTGGSESTLQSLQLAVDRTVASKGLLVVAGHALGTAVDSLTWLQADFEALVAYVATSGAAVRTMGQALRGD